MKIFNLIKVNKTQLPNNSAICIDGMYFYFSEKPSEAMISELNEFMNNEAQYIHRKDLDLNSQMLASLFDGGNIISARKFMFSVLDSHKGVFRAIDKYGFTILKFMGYDKAKHVKKAEEVVEEAPKTEPKKNNETEVEETVIKEDALITEKEEAVNENTEKAAPENNETKEEVVNETTETKEEAVNENTEKAAPENNETKEEVVNENTEKAPKPKNKPKTENKPKNKNK